MFLIVLTVALTVQLASPAFAAVPDDGVVVEGVSVPGIALGQTRAEVVDSYGEPRSCQSGGVAGDNVSCTYDIDGVPGSGHVWISYRGADGGNAGNSPDDVLAGVSWYEAVSGWTTTAGINTALAAENPQAVVDAYPNAVVTYTTWGSVYSVTDYEQGFGVIWIPNFYSGTTTVRMTIGHPRPAPPPPELLTLVTDIDLTVLKAKGNRQIRAFVKVEKQTTLAASGAEVTATWIYPDGSTHPAAATTSGAGWAYFEVNRAARGNYTLTVDDVVLDERRFDAANSVLSAGVRVK
jgi:hypothetical protein